MRRTLIVLTTTLCAVIDGAHAQELWRGALHGDTLPSVVERFPAGEIIENGGTLQRSASVERFEIKDLSIADHQWGAKFFFHSDDLTDVILKTEQEIVGNTAARSSFKDMVGLVRSKYGDETTCENSSDQIMMMMSCHWQGADGLKINLSAIGVGGSINLRVSYSSVGAGSLDLL